MIKFGSNYAQNIQHSFTQNALSFAIVGSGPAGLYTAKHLHSTIDNIHIHVFDKELCPTGLIRYGMAPDHQQIKKVGDELFNNQFTYFGGVEIGRHITIDQLSKMYSGIFYAYGAQSEKKLNIKGEDLPNVYSSRSIVNWYNSHPDYYDLDIDFKDKKTIAIVGNGNVAIDIARVFGQSLERLSKTDVNQIAVEKLRDRNLQNIVIIGRRGVVQSQFTLKELREFSKLEGFRFLLLKDDLIKSLNENSAIECKDQGEYYGNITRANRRKLEFLRKFEIIEDEMALQQVMNTKTDKINIIFRFLLTPIAIEQNQQNQQNLTLTFNQNMLQGEPFKQKSINTNQLEQLNCDMIISSIGYQSQQIDESLRWDNQNNVLDNSNGCLKKTDDLLKIGHYACGWVKTGPKGVIDSTFLSSQESIANFRNHLEKNMISERPNPYGDVVNILKGVPYIDNDVWRRVNEYELQVGKMNNKIREKLSNRDMILNLI